MDNGKKKAQMGQQIVNKSEVYQTAGLLALISMLLLVEGTVRTAAQVNTPSGKWGGDHETFPPAAMIAASSVEVLFGLSGLFVALGLLILDWGSPTATLATIICQCLGWYTFAVYVFASPAYSSARHHGSLTPGLNAQQSNTVVTMGILGSVGVCFALQGSQFFLAFKLLKIQTGKGDIYNAEYHRSRLGIFTGAVLLLAGSQIAIGSVLKYALGGGKYDSPIVSPPFMVFYPELTITMGVLEFVYGLVSVLIIVGVLPSTRSTAVSFSLFGAFIFVCHMAFQNLAQNYAGLMLIIVSSQLVGLLFAVTFFPIYLVAKLCSADGTMEIADSNV